MESFLAFAIRTGTVPCMLYTAYNHHYKKQSKHIQQKIFHNFDFTKRTAPKAIAIEANRHTFKRVAQTLQQSCKQIEHIKNFLEY